MIFTRLLGKKAYFRGGKRIIFIIMNIQDTSCTKRDMALQVARELMGVGAVKLQPENPFTWASGWLSPMYCDNRQALSYPALRTLVKDGLCRLVRELYPEAEAVAGVATGAIAQGALVADALQLPFCYVRPKPKDHGMQNLIEGRVENGAKVVVVEDLISTGGSSLKAVQALRAAGCDVLGMVASFTYGFPVAEKAFADAGVRLDTLSDYEAVLAEALRTGFVREEQLEVLRSWRESPDTWGKGAE